MPTSTLPEGQSLYDFLSEGKSNGKDLYETSSMPQRTEDLHRTIGYPQGQLNKLDVGAKATDLTTAITGADSETSASSAAVVLGQKASGVGKPDLVGPAKSTVVTAPAEMLSSTSGLPDLVPSSSNVMDQIFKSHKGKS
jgi:hypothetical protein